ncbi:MAG: hypothetical protein ABFC67_07900 [Mizugakiibacter sp.]|uniref:hypothetical protein n=1 Tax=Mizugakiibacter sp. TaxID=1972610 RepID=UPI0031C80566|nr:hypothetical protein [Xanthomonadaceae bacterium]
MPLVQQRKLDRFGGQPLVAAVAAGAGEIAPDLGPAALACGGDEVILHEGAPSASTARSLARACCRPRPRG